MKLSFLGAAGTVTGSRHLLTTATKRILVDCGLFQGVKALRLRNREDFPVDIASLDAVVLTHAHLDHTGFLPVLVKHGYRGPIYCTEPTADLIAILLADSGHIQEEDARYARKKGYGRHANPEPLYTEEDSRAVLPLLEPVALGEEMVVDGFRLRYSKAGHILGAASALISTEDGSVLFSGDIGRPTDLLIPAPDPPLEADWIVMESTYGDRDHPIIHPIEALALVLRRTVKRGGVLMIPAFAVGRAQLLLYLLSRVFESGDAPKVPVFLNSPMAIDVTDLYLKYPDWHRLSESECYQAFKVAEYTRTVEESKAINERRGPMVLLAGAGMLTGGRILHHIARFAPDPRNTIALTGYQAEGTRGRDLLSGRPTVKIHGKHIPVRSEVVKMDGLSAHADQGELMYWLGSAPLRPKRVFLVHGEPRSSDAFRRNAEGQLGLDIEVAQDGRTVVLD